MEGKYHTKDLLWDYLPSYLISIHPGGRAVYLILLILILGLLASLPLVSVQVYVSGRGIIRPLQEKANIIAASSGIVSRIYVKEGDNIKKSAPLMQIRSNESVENLESLRKQLIETDTFLEDLNGLTSDPVQIPHSSRYKMEYEEHIKHLDYLSLLKEKAEREKQRQAGLYGGGLISEKEYDDLVFRAEKAGKELDNYISQSLSIWQNEYSRQLAYSRDINIRIRNTEEKIRLTTVHAPASGSMVEFNGIYEGSAIQAGSVIGILSPESGLIAEFYIPSLSAAFVHKGQEVSLHLDAFSSREWGVLPGVIYDISSDFILQDGHPVYRVKCRLVRKQMKLKNGYTAKIKKGMTFRARCLVRKRTLFQLLGDKTENWLFPAMNNKQ